VNLKTTFTKMQVTETWTLSKVYRTGRD
jgi:hypothetical protein